MEEIKNIIKDGNEVVTLTKLERLKRDAEHFNETPGNLTEYDCSICHNKGLIQEVEYNEMYKDYIPVIKKCSCMKKRETIAKAKKSDLGEYINKRFTDYKTDEAWQSVIKKKAIEYVKSKSDNWFVALGQSGSGKTLISCIVASYLLLEENKDVVYITWTDFISKLKRDMMGDNANEVSKYLDSIKNVEVLYIDELLKRYNDTDLKYVIEIINYRYTNNLKTIISSENTIDELLNIDEATFSRAIEKADKYVINIKKTDIKTIV